MNQMVFLCSSILLLLATTSFVVGQEEGTVPNDTTEEPILTDPPTQPPTQPSTQAYTQPTTQAPTQTSTQAASTTTTKKTTKKYRYPYSSGYGNRYNNDYVEVIGEGGIDPRKYGSDIGDFGPVTNDKRSMLSSLDLFIGYADDPDKAGDNDDGYEGTGVDSEYRKKRSYSRVRFPVKRIKNYRKFPKKRFPQLISISPYVPIFYDKRTYQTVIFSPMGGIFIIPPLINFYGRRFAVAQLIKWGYASLVSSGAPIAPGADIAPLVRPPVPGGVPAGPTFDSKTSAFTGGIKTDFRDFKPRYSQIIEEGGVSQFDRPSGPNYGSDSSYGGTRNQQLYPQGG